MEVRRLRPSEGAAKAIVDVVTRVKHLETRPSGTIYVDETIISVDPETGREMHFGILPDGSVGFDPYVNDVTPPGKPSTPKVTAAMGGLEVWWDGKEAGDSAQPDDYSHTDIEYSTDGIAWTLGGTFTNANSTVVGNLTVGTTYQIRLISYDKNKNASEPSTTASGIPVSYVDNEDVENALEELRQSDRENASAAAKAQESAGKAHETATSAGDAALKAAGIANGKGRVIYAPTAPTSADDRNANNLWVDTSGDVPKNTPYRWDATTNKWIAITDKAALDAGVRAGNAEQLANAASAAAAAAATAAGKAQTSANDKNRVWYLATPPAGNDHKVDDTWFDTSNGNMIHRWTGTEWVTAQDAAIAKADKKAADAAATAVAAGTSASNAATAAENAAKAAGAKGKVIIQNAAPDAADRLVQNLWIDTTNGANTPKRWNGQAWVAVTDKKATDAADAAVVAKSRADEAFNLATTAAQSAGQAQASADGKNRVWYSDTAPTGTGHRVGDTWFDSSMDNMPKVWSGSAWISVQDKSIAKADKKAADAATAATNAGTAASTAQTAADNAAKAAGAKGKIIIQSTAPDAADRLPQNLWIDTTGGKNTPKRWVSGTTWTAVTDKAATDAADAAVAAQSKADEAFLLAGSAAESAGLAQESADGKNKVWYSTTEPAGTLHRVNDLWFDEANGNRPMRWNGSKWVTAQDAAIAEAKREAVVAGEAAATAQGSANTAASRASEAASAALAASNLAATKGKVLAQATAPTGVDANAQTLWIDTSGSPALNTPKRWVSGNTWAAVTDKAATDAATLATSKGKVIIQSAAPATADRLIQNLWIDTTNGANTPKRWNSTTTSWDKVTDKTATDAAAAAAKAQADATTAIDAAAAVAITAGQALTSANGKATVRYTGTMPSGTGYNVNDVWFDSANGNAPMRWDGEKWASIQDRAIDAAKQIAETAKTNAAAAQTTADGKNAIYYQTSQPASTTAKPLKQGDMWFDTDDNYALHTYSGAAWVKTQDSAAVRQEVVTAAQAAANAQTAASTAQADASKAIADALAASNLAATKGKVLIQATAPTGVDANAQTLWIDTSGTPARNTPKRWVSGTTWTAVTDKAAVDAANAATAAQTRADEAFNSAVTAATAAGTAQTSANAKARVWYNATKPAGTGHAVNDLWFDSANGNRPMRWNGSDWVSAQDAAIATAKSVADNALTSANGKNTTYYQTAKPTGGTYIVGDTWFDTDDNYALYTYAGNNVWTKTQDAAKALSDAKADATTKANAAEKAAIEAASADATQKKEQAEANAATEASRVAIEKANAAQAAALEAAKTYADAQATGAGSVALEAAKLDATNKANAAEKAAITAAALDATAKKEQAEANAALDAKNKADEALRLAKLDADVKVATKTKTWMQTTRPALTGNILGDTWIDTSTAGGNKLNIWNGSAWVSAQDASIAAAKTVADSALTSANGKNKTYYQTTKPTGGTYTVGDTWFDSANGYALYTYTAPNVWTKTQDAAQALADAKSDAQSKINTAKQAAIDAASADATSKAATAEANAKSVAASDAKTKADAAQAAAIAAAAETAQLKANGAKQEAITAAALDAQAKATAAQTAAVNAAAATAASLAATAESNAKTAAALDAKNKADKALEDAKADSTTKANAAQVAAIKAAAAAATVDIEAAEARVAKVAADDAKAKADAAQVAAAAAAKTYTDAQSLGASAAVLEAAKADATKKAADAEAAAIKAAALDATAKKEEAERVAALDAKNKADEALRLAKLDADAKVATKTKTWIQTTRPALTGNIKGDTWIDSSTAGGNKLNVWDGAAWIAVQDAAIATAQGAATTALTAANGKNKIIFSASDASGTTGYTAGDMWMKRDAAGTIIGQWEFTTTWQKRTIGETVLGNLSAGKITSGTIAADRIGANTITASKILIGDFEEIIPNPYFHPQGEPVAAGFTVLPSTDPSVPVGAPYPNVLVITKRDNTPFSNFSNIPAKPGDEFLIEAWVAAAPTTTRNISHYIYRMDTPTGNGTATTASGQAPTTTWVKKTWTYVTPANEARPYMRPFLQIARDTVHTDEQCTWFVTGWSVRRKTSGELIVDGAIKAGSAIIANGAIGTAQIGEAQITTAKIANAAITDAKIDNLNASKITAGTIAADRLNANDIRAKLITAPLINAEDIIASGSIKAGSAIIAEGAIGSAQIGEAAITSAKIKDAAITDAKIDNLNASKITAGTIAADRLNANDIRAKLITAPLINADDIIAKGSITSASGTIGALDASVITSGYISASRIEAGSLTIGVVAGLQTTVDAAATAKSTVDAWKGTDGKVNAANVTGTLAAAVPGAKVTGTIPVAGVPAIPTSKVTNLDGTLATHTAAANKVDGWTFTGTTQINGGAIKADTITAVQIAAKSLTSESGVFGAINAADITTGKLRADVIDADIIRNKLIESDLIIADEILVPGSITATNGIIGSLDAGKITAGAMDGLYIKANSIDTSKLLIGSIDNLVANPSLVDGRGWSGAAGGTGTGFSKDVVYPGMDQSIKLTQRAAGASTPTLYNAMPSQRIPVNPGESFYASTHVYATGVAPTSSVGQRVYFYDASMTMLAANSNMPAGDSIKTLPANTWTELGGLVTVPADAVYMAPRATVYFDTGYTPTDTVFYMGNVKVYRAAGSTLITKGAVTTDHMTAGKIDGKIITAGTIKGTQIEAKTISTDNLLITSTDNLIQEADFGAKGIGWTDIPSANIVATAGRNGGPALRFTGSSGNQTVYNKYTAAVEPGAVYRLSADIKPSFAIAKDGTSFVFMMVATPVSGSKTYHKVYAKEAIAAGTWGRVSGLVTVPLNTASAQFALELPTGVTSGTVDVDFASVARAMDGELVVDGSITTNSMKAGTIDAKILTAGTVKGSQIEAKTITVDNMLISSTDNFIHEADFSNKGTGWNTNAAWKITEGAGRTGGPAFVVTNTSGAQAIYNKPEDATPMEGGQNIRLSAWVKPSVATIANQVRLGVRVRPSGALVRVVWDKPIAANTWTRVHGTVMLPEDTGTVSFFIESNMSQGTLAWDYVSATRAAGAELIVDGSITTNSITSGGIDASVIKAGTLDAARIGAQSITAEKMVIGQGSNLISDPMFLSAESNAIRGARSTGTWTFPTDTGTGLSSARTTTTQADTRFHFGHYERSAANASKMIPAIPGEKYLVEASVYTSTNMGVRWFFDVVYGDGTNALVTPMSYVAASGRRVVQHEFVVPAKVVAFQPVLQSAASGVTFIIDGGVTVAKKVEGNLIVDGALTGKKITGALIETLEATNRGIKLNADGMVAYNNSGVETLRFSGNTATITGATVQTAASGARVIMDATGLKAYPATGSTPYLSATSAGLEVTGTLRTMGTSTGTPGTITSVIGPLVWGLEANGQTTGGLGFYASALEKQQDSPPHIASLDGRAVTLNGMQRSSGNMAARLSVNDDYGVIVDGDITVNGRIKSVTSAGMHWEWSKNGVATPTGVYTGPGVPEFDIDQSPVTSHPNKKNLYKDVLSFNSKGEMLFKEAGTYLVDIKAAPTAALKADGVISIKQNGYHAQISYVPAGNYDMTVSGQFYFPGGNNILTIGVQHANGVSVPFNWRIKVTMLN